ncbi:hypothetical protein [Paraburkholderia tropica]|uniref:hypothetical protein n=1 Tax=Paraburkholderia tropica TaxID=92647 RepID=UPI001F43FCC5|nr:hypothetical protein [Paraburkholderia tropica]
MKLKISPEFRLRLAADRYNDPELHHCAMEMSALRDKLTLEKRRHSVTAALLFLIVAAVVVERLIEALI